MPNLKVIRGALSELPSGSPIVAAISGGTTGIGSYIAKALAKTFAGHGSKLRVYIVGRNVMRAKEVIAECQKISPDSDWRFVRASNLALIRDVDSACAEIVRQETEAPFHGGPVRVDYLAMTHCCNPLMKPITTEEGLDTFISLTYYSRMRFVLQLIPLLTASPLPGHVVSVYAGGFEDGTKPNEEPIGLPPPAAYGVTGVRKHTGFMKTFFFEELAEKHAGRLVLMHIYPSLVDGPTFLSADSPTWFKILWRALKPFLSLIMTSADDCGQVMAYLATSRFPAKDAASGDKTFPDGVELPKSTNGELRGGAYALGQRADVANKGRMYERPKREEVGKKVWEHTIETLERIEKENAKTA
ncbi:hypothetical protein GQ53DRAFT_848539 [Thozetella sp. PMI_491]|nr:hypothetical protein GQ53DRAFT_848539 [Thozetella sp. PMI_491]